MVNFAFQELNPVLLIFEGVWLALLIGLLVISGKTKTSWARAGIASIALSMLALRTLAILPSWWLYYSEGELGFGGQGCVSFDLSCLKQTVKDTIVVVQNAVVLGLFVVAFLIWQKRNPTQLAPGETKPEATGGYK